MSLTMEMGSFWPHPKILQTIKMFPIFCDSIYFQGYYGSSWYVFRREKKKIVLKKH